jgi:DNA-binding transcriptional regulator LsrR (DeoR family)
MTVIRYTREEKQARMKQVAWWRRYHGCTLAEVGRRLGISTSQARNWEKRAKAAGYYGAEARREYFATRVRGV